MLPPSLSPQLEAASNPEDRVGIGFPNWLELTGVGYVVIHTAVDIHTNALHVEKAQLHPQGNHHSNVISLIDSYDCTVVLLILPPEGDLVSNIIETGHDVGNEAFLQKLIPDSHPATQENLISHFDNESLSYISTEPPSSLPEAADPQEAWGSGQVPSASSKVSALTGTDTPSISSPPPTTTWVGTRVEEEDCLDNQFYRTFYESQEYQDLSTPEVEAAITLLQIKSAGW